MHIERWRDVGGSVRTAALLAGLYLLGMCVQWTDAGERPYRDLSENGSGFLGPGREAVAPVGLKAVKLGLVGPEGSPQGRRLRAGVAMAVREANARGGFNGMPYKTVFRANDGPWGVGVKRVVDLVCQDSVWAIVGGLEGGEAHLAELVAAKLWTPVVAPVASDLSIDYANVPWVFRCFPSDAMQARALIGYAKDREFQHLVVLSEQDREGRIGYARLAAAAAPVGFSLRAHQTYDANLPEAMMAFPGLLTPADAVLVWGRPAGGLKVLRALRRVGFGGPVLVSSGLLSAEFLSEATDLGPVVAVAPYDLSRRDGRMQDFQRRYTNETAMVPDPVALFAYDAACLVIAAIQQAGLNRVRIRDALSRIDFKGLSGRYRFNTLGGASLVPVLMTSRPGTWIRVAAGSDK